MADEENQGWLDDDTDPFDDPAPAEEAHSLEEEKQTSQTETDDVEAEVHELEVENEVDDATEPEPSTSIAWGLPIRAAPLLEERREFVTEYPLKQSVNGRETTSMIVDDELLRVVDTELGVDNQRRMKVRLTVKRDITGFSHQHNELMHQHQFLWIGCFIAGVCLSLVSSVAFGVLGALLMIIGVRSWVLMHLETHSISFSNQGGSHELVMRAYGTNRGFFRASMAMIGPVMADFIRTGDMDTQELDLLHASLLAPPPIQQPTEQFPNVLHSTPPAPTSQPDIEAPTPTLPSPPVVVPAPPTGPPSTPPVPAVAQPPAPTGPPVAQLPPPPPVVAAQLQPPAPTGPPVVMPTPPPPAALPPPAPLPPAPMPPPMPLPPSPGMDQLPPPGGIPLPLDAPLPNAPEIAVAASPVEETLSEDEQNELLNELS